MGVPEGSRKGLWEGMKKKGMSEKGRIEGEKLSEYVPTLEEFNSMIDRMNPQSTGGISDLTYFMM